MKPHANQWSSLFFLFLLLASSALVLLTADAIPTLSQCTKCQKTGITLACVEGHANCRSCIVEKVRTQLSRNEEDAGIGRKLACQHPECAYWINEAQLKWVLP